MGEGGKQHEKSSRDPHPNSRRVGSVRKALAKHQRGAVAPTSSNHLSGWGAAHERSSHCQNCARKCSNRAQLARIAGWLKGSKGSKTDPCQVLPPKSPRRRKSGCSLWDGVVLLDLPTCSPWLNPIEMWWRHFRREVTHCELFETKPALLAAAKACFDRFNQCPQNMLSVSGSKAQKVA